MPVTFTKEIESRVINRKLTKGAIYSIRKGGQPVGRIIRYWAKDLEFPYRTGYTVQELQVDWSHEGEYFWKDTEFFVKNSKFGPNPTGSYSYKGTNLRTLASAKHFAKLVFGKE